MSKKDSYRNKGSYKYFIGYTHKGNALTAPLCKKSPQINAYLKDFDKNSKYMNLFVSDKEIFEK